MLTEWGAECGESDPFIEVPWASPDGAMQWVDLRTDPDALDEIAEADEHPALLMALRLLNAQRSPVFTSKCDVWQMDDEELAVLRAELMLDEGVAEVGLASYIDLVPRERSVFASRYRAEQLLHRMERGGKELPHALAVLECTMRPAILELGPVQEGFGVTLYIKGCGVDAAEAEDRWGAALRDVARMIRSMDAGFSAALRA